MSEQGEKMARDFLAVVAKRAEAGGKELARTLGEKMRAQLARDLDPELDKPELREVAGQIIDMHGPVVAYGYARGYADGYVDAMAEASRNLRKAA